MYRPGYRRCRSVMTVVTQIFLNGALISLGRSLSAGQHDRRPSGAENEAFLFLTCRNLPSQLLQILPTFWMRFATKFLREPVEQRER
jgi:hypothetical protein